MAVCAFGFQNQVYAATITSDDQGPYSGLMPTNLANDYGDESTAWRTTEINPTLTFTWPSPIQISALGFFRSNLLNGQTVIVSFSSGGKQTGSIYDGNGTTNGQWAAVLASPVTADTMTVQIKANGNYLNGYMSVAQFYVGGLWRPARNMSWNGGESFNSGVDEATTLGGTEFAGFRWSQRSVEVDHDSLDPGDMPTLRSMAVYGLQTRNVLFIPDPLSPSILADMIYGRMAPSQVTNPYGPAARKGTKMTFTERL